MLPTQTIVGLLVWSLAFIEILFSTILAGYSIIRQAITSRRLKCHFAACKADVPSPAALIPLYQSKTWKASIFIFALLLVLRCFFLLPILPFINMAWLDAATERLGGRAILGMSIFFIAINFVFQLLPVLVGFAAFVRQKRAAAEAPTAAHHHIFDYIENDRRGNKRTAQVLPSGGDFQVYLPSQPRRHCPIMIVIMPIYNEAEDILWRAISSVVDKSDYPSSQIHLILAFDDSEVTPCVEGISERLGLGTPKQADFSMSVGRYHSALVSLGRFPHQGKRAAQEAAFRYAKDWLTKLICTQEDIHLDETILVLVDSDVILQKDSLGHIATTMINKSSIKAITGPIEVVSCQELRTHGAYANPLLNAWQDVEYFHGQMYLRYFEGVLGSVTCLPGAFTAVRWSAVENIASEYFRQSDLAVSFNLASVRAEPSASGGNTKGQEGDNVFSSVIDYHQYCLGEDRLFTLLLLNYINEKKGKIVFDPDITCTTQAPQTIMAFLRQRRRWLLGAIPNEVALLTSSSLWASHPALLLYYLFNMTRGISLLYYWLLVVLSISHQSRLYLAIPLFMATIAITWITIAVQSAMMGSGQNWKGRTVCFPIFAATQPLVQWCVSMYALLTVGKRTWGGPRTSTMPPNGSCVRVAVPLEAGVSSKNVDIVAAQGQIKSSMPAAGRKVMCTDDDIDASVVIVSSGNVTTTTEDAEEGGGGRQRNKEDEMADEEEGDGAAAYPIVMTHSQGSLQVALLA